MSANEFFGIRNRWVLPAIAIGVGLLILIVLIVAVTRGDDDTATGYTGYQSSREQAFIDQMDDFGLRNGTDDQTMLDAGYEICSYYDAGWTEEEIGDMISANVRGFTTLEVALIVDYTVNEFC